MKHDTEEFKEIARRGTILQTEVGSGVHGISIEGTDDNDLMGICIEPAEYVIGLKKFEQYEHHTAWERPGGLANRSGPGDTDIVIYSLRKWMRLAAQGNPSVLIPLFAPIAYATSMGVELRNNKDMILSRQSGKHFAGYLRAQREKLLGLRGGMDVNRPELIEKYGFDTKYAGHMIRLGYQGLELMGTGRIELPMPEPIRTWIRDLREGFHNQDEALDFAQVLENAIGVMTDHSILPEYPDYDRINKWLERAYTQGWKMGIR
jgi:uncharacterized protein